MEFHLQPAEQPMKTTARSATTLHHMQRCRPIRSSRLPRTAYCLSCTFFCLILIPAATLYLLQIHHYEYITRRESAFCKLPIRCWRSTLSYLASTVSAIAAARYFVQLFEGSGVLSLGQQTQNRKGEESTKVLGSTTKLPIPSIYGQTTNFWKSTIHT